MKYWPIEEFHTSLIPPSDVADVLDQLEASVAEHAVDGFPRLESVQYPLDEKDHCEFTVTVEVVRGLLLSTSYDEEGYGQPIGEAGDTMEELISEGVDVVRPHSDIFLKGVEEIRLEALRMVAKWQSSGLPVRLLKVQLQPYDHWRGTLDAGYEVILEGLGDRLEPAPIVISIEQGDSLEERAKTQLKQLQMRAQTRIAMAEAGADGTIDAMALAVIAGQADVAEVLAELMTKSRVWLPDGSALVWDDGNIWTASSWSEAGGFTWEASGFVAERLFITSARAKSAIGHPVTDLIKHPNLTDGMIVKDAQRDIDGGRLSVSVELDMPRHHFSGSTGAVW